MFMSAQWKGVSKVLENFKKKDDELQAGIERGLKKGAIIIFREAQKRVPVDKGNLRASGFVRTVGKGINTRPQIGYTANYAIYVHEDLSKLHGEAFNRFYAEEISSGQEHSRGGNQQAKWLENAAIVQRYNYIKVIKEEVKFAA